jgi:YHS domain-containing protein
MKRLAFYLMAACLLAGGACANHSKPADSSSAATSDSAQMASAKPINQYCPINKDDKIDPTVTTVYKGKVIGFCCADCIPEFKKDPDKYMATLK